MDGFFPCMGKYLVNWCFWAARRKQQQMQRNSPSFASEVVDKFRPLPPTSLAKVLR